MQERTRGSLQTLLQCHPGHSSACFPHRAEEGPAPMGAVRRKWWPKVIAWNSAQCDVNVQKFYGAFLAKVTSCAHIPLPLVSRACLYFFLMSYKSELQYQVFAHSQSRVIQRAAASSFTSYWPTPNHFFIPTCKKCFSQELQAQTCWLKLLQM